MATKGSEETYIQGNGWTKYQQLVLNELERHEGKLDFLEKEIINLRLANQRLELEIKANTEALAKIMAKIDALESTVSKKIELLDDKREEMGTEVKLLKWKLGGASAVIATVGTAFLQALIKFFLHI